MRAKVRLSQDFVSLRVDYALVPRKIPKCVPRKTRKARKRHTSLTTLQQNVLLAFAAGLIPAATAQRGDYTIRCNIDTRIFQAPKEPVDRLINAIPNTVPYPLDGESDTSNGGHTGHHSFGASAGASLIQTSVSGDCDTCGYSAFGDEVSAMARQGFEACVDSGLSDWGEGRFYNYDVWNGYYTVQVGGGPRAGAQGLAGTCHAVSI
jgi:hypothetical protein